jgi:hypothetical protein
MDAIYKEDNGTSWIKCPKCNYEYYGNVIVDTCKNCGVIFDNTDYIKK